MARALTIVAAGLIILGAVAMAGPTVGFSTLASDRSVSITTAEDPNAYFGIDAQDNIGELAGNDDPAEVSTLTNNGNQQVEVDITIDDIPGEDENILIVDTHSLNLDPGESTTAEVECAERESVGERDVVFRTEATGPSISITDATFTVTIDIQCGKGGGNVEPTDSGLSGVFVSDIDHGQTDESQTIKFDVTEDLSATETVTISLDRATGGNRIDYSGATLSSDKGDSSGVSSGNDYEILFEPTESILVGDTVTITIDGVDTTGNQADGQYDAYFDRSDKTDTEPLEPAFEVV